LPLPKWRLHAKSTGRKNLSNVELQLLFHPAKQKRQAGGQYAALNTILF